MTPRRFTIPAPLMGYTVTTFRAKSWNKRFHRYAAYKDRVRLIANCAGVINELDPEASVSVTVKIYWKKRARIDADDVWKGIADALWRRDRRVLKGCFESVENTGEEERAEVEVWWI